MALKRSRLSCESKAGLKWSRFSGSVLLKASHCFLHTTVPFDLDARAGDAGAGAKEGDAAAFVVHLAHKSRLTLASLLILARTRRAFDGHSRSARAARLVLELAHARA